MAAAEANERSPKEGKLRSRISQTLGLPLDTTFVILLVSGSVAGVLIPSIGWLSDNGSNPTRRKAWAVVLAACFLLTGMCCLVAANAIHLRTTEPGQATHTDHAQTTHTDHGQATDTYGGRLSTDLQEATTTTSIKGNISTSQLSVFTHFIQPTARSAPVTTESYKFSRSVLQGKVEKLNLNMRDTEDALQSPLAEIATSTLQEHSTQKLMTRSVLHSEDWPKDNTTESNTQNSTANAPSNGGTADKDKVPFTAGNRVTKSNAHTAQNSTANASSNGGTADKDKLPFKTGLAMFRVILNSTANASSDGRTSEKGKVPFEAGLAMFGFILLDIGVDMSFSFTKSWMVTCSPRSEHTSVLGTGLVMASAGAIFVCLMTTVGKDAFNSLGRISLPVHAIIDAVLVIVLILLSLTLTLMVGTRRLTSGKIVEQTVNINTKSYNSMDRTDQTDQRSGQIETGFKEDQISPKKSTGIKSLTFRYDNVTNETDSDIDLGRKGNQNSPKQTTAVNSSPFCYEKLTNETDADSTPCALTTTQKGIDDEQRCSRFLKPQLCGTEQSLKLKVCLICVSAYFSFATEILNSINVPDFVGKAVYGGHPEGQGDTDSAERYQAGVTMAAWGFVVYYGVYMVLSSVHTHVLNRLGYKAEFLLIQLAMSGSLVLMILTARVDAFFWSMAVAGTQRVCTHVTPFAVINDVMQAEVEKDSREGSARVGLGMSIVSAMSSLALITIFPCLGPLEEVTRLVSIPLWIAAGCGCAAAACFFIIDIPRKR
ncbi:uncharacterized protein [Littorina saxatilis]|uniref:uncharacterized protein n=1 Tax=Littorina saxatilis TaxID=31220 RepID=UPI0038B55502